MRWSICLTLLLLLLPALPATADDPILYEGFAYDVGDELKGNQPTPTTLQAGTSYPWNQPTAPAPNSAQALIVDANLSYSGLAAPTGNAFSLSRTHNGNISTNRIWTQGFPASASHNVYFSFLMRLEDIVADPNNFGANATHQNGEFFAGLTTASGTGAMSGANVYAGMVRIRRDLDEFGVQTGNFNLGVHKNNNPGGTLADLQWSNLSLAADTTVLVVGNYQLNTGGTTNDVVKLWINPTSFGGTEPAADLTVTNGSDVVSGTGNQGAINSIWFRDGAGSVTETGGVRVGPITIDEVRVGQSFAAVTPAAAAPLKNGDYNDDGFVDAADYVAWRKLGPSDDLPNETVSPDVVDAEDYAEWVRHFGAEYGGGASAPVPEPASFGLVALLLALVPSVRRRAR